MIMYGNSNVHPFLENRSLKISHHLSKYFSKLSQYHGHLFYIVIPQATLTLTAVDSL